MSAYPAWTPASRPGIVPLHPLSFGTILGRSFVALRQNPRVLLGFALVVQTVAYLVVMVAIGGVAFATFSRLATLRPGSEDFATVMAGSVAITAVTGILLGIAAGVLSTVVQAVVVVEVTRAVVAEKLALGEIWRRVKPIVWRLIGYSALLILAVATLFVVVGGLLFLLGTVTAPLAIGLAVLVVLAAIPLTWWLTIKLLLVPSTIIIERATIGQAIRRSWTLVRGRFWSSLGVVILISMMFGAVAQVVNIPFSFLSAGLTTVVTPTGDPEVAGIVGLLVTSVITYAVILLIQSMALVVQSTATALIYVDCRMRREGLDLDLLAYVERRDAGAADLPDPYTQNIGREVAPRPAAPAYAPPQGYPPYPAPAAQPYPVPATQPYPGQQPYAGQPYPPQQPPYAGQPYPPQQAPPAPPAAPPTQWAPPGTTPDGADRPSSWS